MADIVQQELAVRAAVMDIAPVGSLLIKADSPGRLYEAKMPDDVFLGKLSTNFDFNDAIIGFKSIGRGRNTKSILHCCVQIIESFDGDTRISVGKDTAQGILMTIDDIFSDFPAIYSLDVCINVIDNEEFKVYFSTNSPTKGRGQVIVQLN